MAAAGLLGLFASIGVAHAQGTTPFLYSANSGAGRVDTYNSAGGLISSTANGQIFGTKGIVADASGNIFATAGNQIFKFAAGTGTKTTFATDPNADNEIYGLALDSANNLYFGSETTGNVYKVAASGGASTVFATGAGNPGALVFDGAGNLYVGDQGPGAAISNTPKNGNTVFEVGPSGGVGTTYATGFSSIGGTDVLGLAFNPADTGARAGTLYVSLDQNASGTNSGVQIAQVAPGAIPGTGGTISTYVTLNTGKDPGFFPASIAFDQSGNLYYVNNGGSGVVEKAVGGTGQAAQFGSATTGNGFGIALAPTAAPPAPAPEPSTLAAFGFIGLGVGALTLKARKRSAPTA